MITQDSGLRHTIWTIVNQTSKTAWVLLDDAKLCYSVMKQNHTPIVDLLDLLEEEGYENIIFVLKRNEFGGVSRFGIDLKGIVSFINGIVGCLLIPNLAKTFASCEMSSLDSKKEEFDDYDWLGLLCQMN